MINYTPTLYNVLKTTTYDNKIVECQPEHFVIPTDIPCITYLQIDNSDYKKGTNVRYSNLGFQITIWGKRQKEVDEISMIVDRKLQSCGFDRGNCVDGTKNEVYSKIMSFYATGYENNFDDVLTVSDEKTLTINS